ncbi:MAG TPA: hypothetical protein VKZ75_10170 [Cyclobacteriaceae bacterium]|nr:hypothetical protein [Cyclobacteriaceae bacterium]
MIRYIFSACVAILVLMTGQLASGQDTPPAREPARRGLPDLPGSFVLEFGFNQTLDAPDTFDLGFWGSRSVNVFYQFDKRIGNSKFSIHPGLGLSLERFKLKNNYTLTSTVSTTELVPASDFYPGIKKSMLVTNYLEVPVEIRFSTRPDDPSRSFRLSVGGRIGYLYDSFTKIKYSEEGEVKTVKSKQNYNLTKLRYGTFFKVGAGNIGLIAYYNLTPLFEEGEGPEQTEMSTFTIGLSVSSF